MDKKEKEINELIEFILKIANCSEYKEIECLDKECEICQAKHIINAGYRKADEVKKETAIAIGKEIKELMKSPWANNESLCERRVSIQEALRAVISLCIEKDYGVEL